MSKKNESKKDKATMSDYLLHPKIFAFGLKDLK